MSNLIESNFTAKVNMTLLQTAVIADQNGGKCGKARTNRGNEELSFLARAIWEGRKSQRIPKGTSQFLVQFIPAISFLQDSFVLYWLKSMTHRAPPNCLLSNPLHSFSNTEHHIKKWFNHQSSKYHFDEKAQEFT